jgi:hypothetical protein
MNRLYVRKFLNKSGHHAGAYVHAVVEHTSPTDDPDRYVNVTLTITDCSHQISLEFPLWRASRRANSVYKARLLADVLARFADAVEEEAKLVAERRSRLPRARRNIGHSKFRDVQARARQRRTA